MERSTIFHGKIHYFYGHIPMKNRHSPAMVLGPQEFQLRAVKMAVMALLRRFAEEGIFHVGKRQRSPFWVKWCAQLFGDLTNKKGDVLIYYMYIYIYIYYSYIYTYIYIDLYVNPVSPSVICGCLMFWRKVWYYYGHYPNISSMNKEHVNIGHWILMDFRDTLFSDKRQTRAELVASPNKGAWKFWEHVVVLSAEFSYWNSYWWVHCCFGFMFSSH